ncbi:MAG: acyl-CoA thioesterase [Pseudomonadota bacterium]|nr:acyl-CoA thioesterase [Pseudomonadota bacterium]
MKPDAHLRTAATYPMTRAMDTHFADMDIGGHLNNVALARHFEDGRVALQIEMFGIGAYDPSQTRPFHITIVQSTINYLREVRFPAPLQCGVGVSHIGRSSYRLASALFQHDHCVAVCECVMVLRSDGAALPFTDELRAQLETFRLRDVPASK